MTLIEALQNASQILDAERTASTTNYMSPTPFANQAAMAASALGQRGWHPRPVSENPGYYYLQSRNYELVVTENSVRAGNAKILSACRHSLPEKLIEGTIQ